MNSSGVHNKVVIIFASVPEIVYVLWPLEGSPNFPQTPSISKISLLGAL